MPLDGTPSTKEKPTVLVVHETVAQSLASDMISVALAIGLIGIGHWFGSAVMEWFGFILASMSLVSRAANHGRSARRTPQQAADYIRDKWGVVSTLVKD